MSNVTRMPNVSSQNWPQQNWWGSGSWPPSCNCGCNPCQCGGGFGGLMQCWQDIAQFQQFLQCMLSQMGPIPMKGVTDGSVALAGNIGEVVTQESTGQVATGTTSQVASVLTLPPGDWFINSWISLSSLSGTDFYQAASVILQSGATSLADTAIAITPAAIQSLAFTLSPVHLSVSVPSLLSATIDISATLAAPKTWALDVAALRIR